MKIQKLFFLVCVCFALTPAIAQYTIPPPSGDPCTRITQDRMRAFESQLREVLRVAEQDRAAYGTGGTSAVNAINFRDHVKNAVDTARRMVDWYTAQGHTTSPVPVAVGSWSAGWLEKIVDNLKSAAWWASLSAIYNKSPYASCGMEKCMQGMAEAVNLLTYSYRCYISGYVKDIPPCK
jgi:hypothetical protein